jgi:antitoxin (DNA-binding transcriptional repressor) of toxin-antitoxin stability system
MPKVITIKQLHATTGDQVRRASASKSPVFVTDHGETVAAIVNPSLLRPRRRRRSILPEYEALMALPSEEGSAADLDAVRGER